MYSILRTLKRLVPTPAKRVYHFVLALIGAAYYGFPSRKLTVIGVTGTKGKSTVVEMARAVLSDAGYSVASSSTVQFTIAGEQTDNRFKMTMPGRFFLQQFLARAVKAGCSHAVIEMTSEGAAQFRHRGIDLDVFIFTNIEREHIESHGSFEKYIAAKRDIARQLERSGKRPRTAIINADDNHADTFTDLAVERIQTYAVTELPHHACTADGCAFTYDGTDFSLALPGVHNVSNALAVISLADTLAIPRAATARALAHISRIPGRAERIDTGQPFPVIVDYAHTPESLAALLAAYNTYDRVCVFGATGGGRDKWKRPELGRVADASCEHIILTNEDPYDEDPEQIIADIQPGISKHAPEVIVDRRAAIRRGIEIGMQKTPDAAVLIAGKGTDPYIMGPNGTREPWSDADVAREEIQKLLEA